MYFNEEQFYCSLFELSELDCSRNSSNRNNCIGRKNIEKCPLKGQVSTCWWKMELELDSYTRIKVSFLWQI